MNNMINEISTSAADLLMNPANDNRTLTDVLDGFRKQGGKVLGTGKYATVLYHSNWNYVLKIFNNDMFYLKFARFVMKNPKPSFPKLYDKPRKIIPHFKRFAENQYLYVVPIEKLDPITKEEFEDIKFYLYWGLRDKSQYDQYRKYQNWADAEKHITEVEQKYPKIEQFAKDYKFFEGSDLEGSHDFQRSNIMKRSNGEFVIADPLWEGETPYQRADRLEKMEMDYHGYDDEQEPTYIKGGEKYKKPKPQKPIKPSSSKSYDDVPFQERLVREIVNELKFPPPLGDTSDNLPEAIFPKEFDRHQPGSCMVAAELATKYLLKKGVSQFKIIEGWVSLFPDQEKEDWQAHTWIEFKNGRTFDPTKKQWKQMTGSDIDPEITVEKIKTEYTPEEYLEVCEWEPGDWKKFKKPVNENDPVAPEEQPGHGKATSGRKMTYDDLLQATTPARKVKADHNVRVRSIPVSVDNEGHEQWNFRYSSDQATGDPGGAYQGRISFLKGEVGKDDDAIELLCEVDCKCKDYMYRFAYNNAAQGAGQVGRDSLSGVINRKPKPAYDYGVGLCKHLAALRKYLQTKIKAASTKKQNIFEAVGDVARQGPFKIQYYD